MSTQLEKALQSFDQLDRFRQADDRNRMELIKRCYGLKGTETVKDLKEMKISNPACALFYMSRIYLNLYYQLWGIRLELLSDLLKITSKSTPCG